MGPGASEVKYADFVGVTTNGQVQDDLYAVHSTGVSTDALVKAAPVMVATAAAPPSSSDLFMNQRRVRSASAVRGLW
ncbi:hypothetical protein [Streptomyces sp. V4I8]|uniref:hypothetical protein n=1 Tax=Streptomyces sp. V4I8 TaxID=3156469 RepID=UPI0035198E21